MARTGLAPLQSVDDNPFLNETGQSATAARSSHVAACLTRRFSRVPPWWHRTRPLEHRRSDECDRERESIRTCGGRRCRPSAAVQNGPVHMQNRWAALRGYPQPRSSCSQLVYAYSGSGARVAPPVCERQRGRGGAHDRDRRAKRTPSRRWTFSKRSSPSSGDCERPRLLRSMGRHGASPPTFRRAPALRGCFVAYLDLV